MSEVLIIGGGLGGLACATLCAQKGHRVRLIERGAQTGGRARSQPVEGVTLNLGPHALYRKGLGMPILRRLGLDPKGGLPPNEGKGLLKGEILDLPFTPVAFASSKALDFRGRLALTLWMAGLPLARPQGPVSAWLAPLPEDTRRVAEALIRVSTYCNAPERLDSAFAADQLLAALMGGVLYLHQGWGQLVEALTAAATAAGVQIQTGIAAERVEERAILLQDGSRKMADHVVLALPPDPARRLGVPWPEVTPVRAACLDLVLERMPFPERRFILGLDQPLYLSEHTGVAQLGQGCVLHVAKYLAPEEGISGLEEELEAFVDLSLPGWRELLRARRWRGAPPVFSALPEPGKPRPEIQIYPWLWRVGDRVGKRGMLADATLASAEDVAAGI